MRALIAAVALIFIAGISLPADVEAKTRIQVRQWAALFTVGSEVDTDPGCRSCSPPPATYWVGGGVRITLNNRRRPLELEEIRVSLWRIRAGKRDVRIAIRTLRDKTLKPHVAYGPGVVDPRFCDRALGTRYYAKARIKKAGQRAIWLNNRNSPAELKVPCLP
ncbi:MAG: hypothetical protein ACC726_12595 [Chloroflexota bacterium]